MTMIIYQEWISGWDCKLRHQNWHILLLQDNFSGHVPPVGLTNIRVENFSPNLTPHVQPADAGIIHCFKAHYCSKFNNRAIDRYDGDISPLLIYEIDQLKAMQIADIAWKEVTVETIHNCWYKTGILPESLLNPSDVPTPSVPISTLLNQPGPTVELEVINSLT